MLWTSKKLINNANVDEILKIIEPISTDIQLFDSSILHLAYYALNTIDELARKDKTEALKWGTVAQLSFEMYLLIETSDENTQSVEDSMMAMRIKLISIFGADEHNALLNLKIINDWCLAAIEAIQPSKLQQVKSIAWSELNLNKDELKQLGKIKNRLRLCKLLFIDNANSLDEKIRNTIPYIDNLP